MKTISAELRTHLDETVTSLATIWRIIRTDSTNFYFTDHDVDIDFNDGEGSATYLAESGYTRTSVANNSSLSVGNMDVEGLLSNDGIKETELRAGLFDYAEVRISMVNWFDLTQGALKLRKGHLGEVILTPSGVFRSEMRGLTSQLSQQIVDSYQAECRVDLGSPECGIPIQPDVISRNLPVSVGQFYRVATTAGAPLQKAYQNRIYEVTIAGTTAGSEPTYDIDIGDPTVDGSATLVAVTAWTRHAVVSDVTNQFKFDITVSESRAVNNWFNGGTITIETGNNAGFRVEIKDWVQSSGLITTFLGLPFVLEIGDEVALYPGCDKSIDDCKNKFNNVINYRGEPHIPGQDTLTRYPDAG